MCIESKIFQNDLSQLIFNNVLFEKLYTKEGIMKIKLRSDWNNPINPPYTNELVKNGIFVGRQKEVDILKNDIMSISQGSILISGHRGVGKTSFVYHVLHQIKKSNANTLFVYLNAGQFEIDSEDKSNKVLPEHILKTIIRRLYSSGKEIFKNKKRGSEEEENEKVIIHDTEDRLQNLYIKAVSKDFKLSENLLQTKSEAESNEKIREINYSLEKLDFKKLAPFICFIISSLLLFFKPFTNEVINNILIFVFAFPIPFTINYTFSKKKTKSNETQKQLRAEKLYELDNNIGNLEYDFEEFHRWLSTQELCPKIIYIIDELDKLGTTNTGKVIKYLKNLFTLSKAIFIFIGSEDMYQRSSFENDGKEFRSEFYTYFTSKYFISRPTFQDLVDYLSLISDETTETSNIDSARLMHYFAFEAKNDFFDLINVVKSHIQAYENNKAILEIDLSHPLILKKIRLHHSLSLLYYKKYYSDDISKMHENEKLLRHLIAHIQTLYSLPILTQVDDSNDDSSLGSAIRDLNSLLATLNFLKEISETSQKMKGLKVLIKKYQCTSMFLNDPPSMFELMTESETKFITISNAYLDFIYPIVELFRKTGELDWISLDQLHGSMSHELEFRKNIVSQMLFVDRDWLNMYLLLNQKKPINNYINDEVEIEIRKIQEKQISIQNKFFEIIKNEILPLEDKLDIIIGKSVKENTESSQLRILLNLPIKNSIIVGHRTYDYCILIFKNEATLLEMLEKIEKSIVSVADIYIINTNDDTNKEKTISSYYKFLYITSSEDLKNITLQLIDKIKQLTFENTSKLKLRPSL